MQLEARTDQTTRWVNVGFPNLLTERGRALVKLEGRSIAIFRSNGKFYACNNRCPHEGFPLLEGVVTNGCLLTCNWHNWKFDLESGETIVGGDKLRRYPIEERNGELWIDLADPPEAERVAQAKANLVDAMDDFDYARMAREIARLRKLNVDDREILATAITHVHDRLEFGTTHAFAAAADWVMRARATEDAIESAIPILEAISHMARDALREPRYPFSDAQVPFERSGLIRAIEEEDEVRAIGMVRDAIESGLGTDDLLPALAEAALNHYADFGHSAIYVAKTAELIDQLGEEVELPLLLALVRALIYATREDLIPEFRPYGKALEDWDGAGDEPAEGKDFHGLSVREALARALRSSGRREELYVALLAASGWNMLHFDTSFDQRTDVSVDDNVNWLDFTHAITFANAARRLCERQAELWPKALLQMACFVGRNKMYVREDNANEAWRISDPSAFLAESYEALNDHGTWRSILACHRLKTLTAVEEETRALPDQSCRGMLLAGLNRYLHANAKGKHVMRTMRQAMDFVDQE